MSSVWDSMMFEKKISGGFSTPPYVITSYPSAFLTLHGCPDAECTARARDSTDALV